jgi:hypothetical protein
MVVLVLNDAAVKWMSGDYPVHEIVLVRSLVAIPLTVLVLAPLEGGRIRLRTARWREQPWVSSVPCMCSFPATG